LSPDPIIVIAGASGYIGREIILRLLEKFPQAQITALSRSQQISNDPRVIWQACDLFSLKSLESAVPKKVDYALYLVHSMGPTAQLDQGSFADYDLILADNFSRSIKNSGIKQLIYLGGLIPDTGRLSLHL
jgi:nucleoside-diphosphate-sugar epimerase